MSAAFTDCRGGKYLIRNTNDNFGLQTEGVEDGYVGSVNSPTPYGACFVRIVLKDLDADVKIVHSFQDQIKATVVPRSGPTVAPPWGLQLWKDAKYIPSASLSVAQVLMNLLATLSPYNKARMAHDREWVAEKLAEAGIKHGRFEQPPNTSLTRAVELAHEAAKQFEKSADILQGGGNGWFQTTPSITGDYGSHYTGRYYQTLHMYLQMTADQGVLPFYSPSGKNTFFPLAPGEAYLFTFSSRPPLYPTGYWSLTIYDSAQFFIADDLNRYSLGDRSAIKYSDRTPLNDRDNEPFDILLQPADLTPPANWANNWIPGPPCGGDWTLNLRLFGPRPEITNGTWQFPKVTKIAVITENRHTTVSI